MPFFHKSDIPRDLQMFFEPAVPGRSSVFRVNPRPYAGAHFACVDENTEALTPTGWKRHTELHDDNIIAVYDDQSDTLSWGAASFHRYDYDGEMVVIDKRDSSQWLTPNHRCLIKRRSGRTTIVTADELKPGMKIPQAADFDITPIRSIGVDLAALLGWYIAEGSSHHPGYIYIYQSDTMNPDNVKEIRRLLVNVGADFKETTRKRPSGFRNGRVRDEVEWSVSRETALALQALVPDKRLTVELAVVLPADEAEAVLRGLVGGDGHTRLDDGRRCFVQKDRICAEAVQILAIRLGLRAHLTWRADIDQHVVYFTNKRWLTLRGTNGSHSSLSRKPYQGVVWCPSVRTGLWLARRDGKPFITGNTWPEALVEPMIQAGSGEKGCCSKCLSPLQRVTEVVGKVQQKWGKNKQATLDARLQTMVGGTKNDMGATVQVKKTTGWEPTCECEGASIVPCTVLDPFSGSATTGAVALRLGRSYIGCDLQPDYLDLAVARLEGRVAPSRDDEDDEDNVLDLFE